MPRKSPESETTQDALDPFAAYRAMAPKGWMNTGWFENIADLGSELTNFVAERIKEDVKTQHEILHCKNLQELQDVQAKFLQRAFDDYQAESGKLIDMTGKMAVEMAPKQPESGET